MFAVVVYTFVGKFVFHCLVSNHALKIEHRSVAQCSATG